MSKSRHWCFTVNNPNNVLQFDERVHYAVWQLEQAPGTGTLHYQGYMRLKNANTFNGVRNLLPDGTHIEIARNTIAAEHYCTKQDSRIDGPYTHGTRDDNDKQNLLEKAATLSKTEFFEHCVANRIPKGYYDEALRLTTTESTTIMETNNEWNTRVREPLKYWILGDDITTSWLIIGPSGIGKTSWAKDRAPKPALFVTHMDDLKAFKQQYHRSIIFDDMDFKHTPRTAQIHITDVQDGRSIHIRYGTVYLPPGIRKIFLANEMPFNEDPAIKRRLHIINLNKPTIINV